MDGRMDGWWMDGRTDRGMDGAVKLTTSIWVSITVSQRINGIFPQCQSRRLFSSVAYDSVHDCLEVTQVPHSGLVKTHRFHLSHLDAGNLAEIPRASSSSSRGNKVDYDERGGLQERVAARRHGSGAPTAGETECL